MLKHTACTMPAGRGQVGQVGGLVGRHAERLLAHDVLAGREHGSHLLGVDVVRAGDVHDVDRRVGEQRVDARRRPTAGWRWPPCARARSGVEPTTPTTSTPSRRRASVWATPMMPVPITAALMSRSAITHPSGPSTGRRPIPQLSRQHLQPTVEPSARQRTTSDRPRLGTARSSATSATWWSGAAPATRCRARPACAPPSGSAA